MLQQTDQTFNYGGTARSHPGTITETIRAIDIKITCVSISKIKKIKKIKNKIKIILSIN